jgi:peroxiredoxin
MDMAGVTIAAQVEEMKRSGPDEPDPRMAAFAREQARLDHAQVPAGVAEVGSRLPDADLLAADGSRLSLTEALGDGFTVVVLYRGAWCPYCNLTLRTYQSELLPGLRERGAELVALSPQKPDGSLTMKQKHHLEFAVLSDPGLAVARAVGVVTAPTEDSLAAQVELGLDLGEVNADGTAALPMPTVAIIDDGLKIHWIDVHPDYTTRTEPDEIFGALDALEGGS